MWCVKVCGVPNQQCPNPACVFSSQITKHCNVFFRIIGELDEVLYWEMELIKICLEMPPTSFQGGDEFQNVKGGTFWDLTKFVFLEYRHAYNESFVIFVCLIGRVVGGKDYKCMLNEWKKLNINKNLFHKKKNLKGVVNMPKHETGPKEMSIRSWHRIMVNLVCPIM